VPKRSVRYLGHKEIVLEIVKSNNVDYQLIIQNLIYIERVRYPSAGTLPWRLGLCSLRFEGILVSIWYLRLKATANHGQKCQPHSVLVSVTLKCDANGSENPNSNALFFALLVPGRRFCA